MRLMVKATFIDSGTYQHAFLGNRLSRLVEMIVEQGEVLLREADISFPARAASTILIVAQKGVVSTSDIARELAQPHQVATQRVELLIKNGLIEKRTDPSDARRKLLALTKRGTDEARRLETVLEHAQFAFLQLFEELGVDISDIALQAMRSLENKPLVDREPGATPKRIDHTELEIGA